MNVRLQIWLWFAQRISGALLAVLVCVHLVTIIIAVQGGLSAAEISARLAGNAAWLAFYGLFVVAAAVHAPIGLRNVLAEWTPLGDRACVGVSAVLTIGLLWLGFRAAFAMYAS